jgi:hypothetical protein
MSRPLISSELTDRKFFVNAGLLSARTFDNVEYDSTIILFDVAYHDLAGWSGLVLFRCDFQVDRGR